MTEQDLFTLSLDKTHSSSMDSDSTTNIKSYETESNVHTIYEEPSTSYSERRIEVNIESDNE